MQAIAPATSSPGRVGMMPATKPRTIIEVALPVTSEGLGGLDATIRAHGGHNGRGARPAIRLDSGAELHGAHGHRRVLSSGGDESSNSRRSTAVASTLVSARLAPLGHGQAPASAGGNGVMGQAYNGGSSTGSILTKPSVDPFNVRCCPPDQFVPDAHVLVCMAPGCGTSFSLFYRKHHCRMCGRIFCSACCSNIVHLPTTGPSPHNSPYTTYGNNSQCSLAVPPGSPLGRPRGAAEVDEFSPSIQNSPRRGLSGRGGVSGTPEPSAVYSRTYSNRHVNTNSFDFAGPGDHGGDPLGSTVGSMHLHPPLQPFRVCSACYYEVQLAVPTRQEDGTLRRKSRGELKMFHRSLLVHILSYLTLPDLREVALVSADFYFMSRDNVIWYGYNMTRWAKDKDLPQPLALARGGAGVGASANRRAAMNAPSFQAAAVLNDATALSESEAAKRVISLHARYSFSQFLDFARRMEMARCEGLSSFTLGARILLSNPIKIAIVGPSRVGKTASIRSFLGEEPSTMVVHPTAGFCRYDKTVKVVGGLMADVTFHLYDLSGESRYEELRRFICSQCHAIGLCYDPQKKLTLVQAADIMMGIEPSLGPQPVVVCGLIRNTTAPVAEVTPPHESPSRAESVPRISSLHLAKEGKMEFNAADDDDVGDGESASGAVDGGAEGGESPPLAPSFTDLPNDSERGLPAVEEPSPGVDVSSPSYSSTSRRARNGAVGGAFSPPGMPPLEVSEQDAEDITVRGGGSLQCSLFHSDAFYAQLLQALLTRLAMATMGCTAMTMSAMTEEGRRETDPRGYRVDQAVAQELLAITMEPCALDVLLN